MEETRKLATVVKVIDLAPIIGRDLIEVAVVKGWRCIVKKGEFKIGDLAIYFAIDSVPDFDDPHFSFLKGKHNRIKTIKMAGVVSQGLLGQLSWYAERTGNDSEKLQEFDDITEAMGIVKYIHEEEYNQYSTGKSGSNGKSVVREEMPPYVLKTDSVRLQNNPESYFAAIADKSIVITRKEDGCSCTFIFKDGDYKICGRNYVWNEEFDVSTVGHYFHIQDKFQLKEKLFAMNRNIAIQGEIIGPKVNGNRLKLKELSFSVFDVFDIDHQSYLSYDEMVSVCHALELPTVPVVYRGPAAALEMTVEYFLSMAESVEYLKGVGAEGMVVRTDIPSPAEAGAEAEASAAEAASSSMAHRVHFKVISNKYLLKHDL
mmetsp:Transcript_12396/g.20625  ORF Transcript_12396/g.20625 Transcript_12396/m.20625 type:complete len:373 (-) Transcript_12396:173-1291(-)